MLLWPFLVFWNSRPYFDHKFQLSNLVVDEEAVMDPKKQENIEQVVKKLIESIIMIISSLNKFWFEIKILTTILGHVSAHLKRNTDLVFTINLSSPNYSE